MKIVIILTRNSQTCYFFAEKKIEAADLKILMHMQFFSGSSMSWITSLPFLYKTKTEKVVYHKKTIDLKKLDHEPIMFLESI